MPDRSVLIGLGGTSGFFRRSVFGYYAIHDSEYALVIGADVAQAKQQVLVEEIRTGTRDILGEAVDLDAVNYDEGW